MKRIIIGLVILSVLFCGCGKTYKSEPQKVRQNTYLNGVWISYIELDKMVSSGDFYGEFSNVVSNCMDFGITDIFLHTVPFCDAIYNSEIYGKRYDTSEDILKTAIDICHAKSIRLHAWINPYRVKTGTNDKALLKENSPAYKWLNDEKETNDINVLLTDGGIYLNPASNDTRLMVINGIRELCLGYQIDGIHFDDYFYPTTDETFDEKSYDLYKSATEYPLSLADFRRANVNALVSSAYTAIKFINKDIIFSVSPAADKQKNYETLYADIDLWCRENCVDYIIPQLYFGFSYIDKRFCFENILNEWKTLATKDVKLVVGLGVYKIFTPTKADGDEWQTRDDVLKKQTAICLADEKVSGQVFYSYSSLFSSDERLKKIRDNIKKELKAEK